MFNFRRKKNQPAAAPESSSPATAGELAWDDAAAKALDQAAAQAPVPQLLKNKLRSELKSAAEHKARAAGHASVSAEDLMQGLLDKLPANMRDKITRAAQEGPVGLQKLEQEFKKDKQK